MLSSEPLVCKYSLQSILLCFPDFPVQIVLLLTFFLLFIVMHFQKVKLRTQNFWILLAWLLLLIVFLLLVMAFLVFLRAAPRTTSHPRYDHMSSNQVHLTCPAPRPWVPRLQTTLVTVQVHAVGNSSCQPQQNCLSILSPLILLAISSYESWKIEWNKNLVGIQCITPCDEIQSEHTARLAAGDTEASAWIINALGGMTLPRLGGCRLNAFSQVCVWESGQCSSFATPRDSSVHTCWQMLAMTTPRILTHDTVLFFESTLRMKWYTTSRYATPYHFLSRRLLSALKTKELKAIWLICQL